MCFFLKEAFYSSWIRFRLKTQHVHLLPPSLTPSLPPSLPPSPPHSPCHMQGLCCARPGRRNPSPRTLAKTSLRRRCHCHGLWRGAGWQRCWWSCPGREGEEEEEGGG